jgi:hypothetical protein
MVPSTIRFEYLALAREQAFILEMLFRGSFPVGDAKAIESLDKKHTDPSPD